MLATLNLQLLPAELPDETLQTPASLVPDGLVEAPAGFADLLRLRVDSPVVLPAAAGEFLPQGGSELPLEPGAMAAPLSAELPVIVAADTPAPEVLGQMVPVIGLQTLSDEPLTDAEINLETLVTYPTKAPAEGITTAAPALPLAPSTAVNPPIVSDAASLVPALETRSLPFVERPVVTQPPLTPEPPLTRELAASMTDRSPPTFTAALPPERTVANTTQQPAAAAVDRSSPLPELPMRPTMPASADRSDAIARELAPLLRTRPVVAQPSQALHAQLNLQQPPNLLATPAPSVVSTDLSYAAAAQQATDLIGTSVRDSIWGERVGERVIMMAGNQLRSAEIRLTPAELGPLRVQVAIDDGAANVTFHAQHAVTRDALEQALPRLREMLAENGLTLGNAQVGDDGVRQGSRDAEAETAASTAAGSESPDSAVDQGSDTDRRATLLRGLVDTFA